MTKSYKIQTIPKRRKKQCKTDYRKRLRLLKSRKPRLVIRKSLKNILAQIIEYSPKGDKIILSVHSKELEKNGWKYSRKNTPAGYLVGLMLGIKAKKMKITEVIADIGLASPVKKSKIYAIISGVKDAGVHVPMDETVIPSKERISGNHIVEYGKKAKETKEVYEKQFSGYVKKGVTAEKITEDFEKIKAKIMQG